MKISASSRFAYLNSILAFQLVGRATANPLIETDVIVVGGGISGMTSAYELHNAGLKTIVLEAKEDIGGRCRSVQRQSGAGIVELGATWINNVTQPDVYALTELFGLETAAQYTDGHVLYQARDGGISLIPHELDYNINDEEQALLVGQLFELLQVASLSLDLHDFQAFPEEQDVTMAEWIALQNETLAQTPHVMDTMTHLSSQLVGREAHEVGAHYLLDYIGSGEGLVSLGGEDPEGAQFLKIKSGTQSIVRALADTLEPGSVHVCTPVEAISTCGEHTIVASSTGQLFQAKKVIMANPTSTYPDITFIPALPAEKTSLVSQTMPGVYAKLIISYTEHWWRDAGLVGEFISFTGPVCFGWDTSNLDLEQYSIAIFVAGDVAREWHQLPDEAAKQAAVVEHLAELVGEELAEKALNPLEINMAEWTLEDYLHGGPTSSMGPGMLRQYGEALRQPFGDIHFGGGETAYEWKGYLEGAVRAGRRAAEEVIAELVSN